ncbi:MAG: hypothetical protein ACLFP4_09255 [Spirochaetales bacterium]
MKKLLLIAAFVVVAVTGCLLQLENPNVILDAAPAYNDARISVPFFATGVASPARVVWELEFYDTLTTTWVNAGSGQLQLPTETYGTLELGELPQSKYRLTVQLLGSRSNKEEVAFQRVEHEFYVDRVAPNVSDITGLSTNPSTRLASEDVYLTIAFVDTSNPDSESPHRVLVNVEDFFLTKSIHEVNGEVLLWQAGDLAVSTTVTAYAVVIDEAGNRSDMLIQNFTTQ